MIFHLIQLIDIYLNDEQSEDNWKRFLENLCNIHSDFNLVAASLAQFGFWRCKRTLFFFYRETRHKQFFYPYKCAGGSGVGISGEIATSFCKPKNPSQRARTRALALEPLRANSSVDIITIDHLFHLFWTWDAWEYRFVRWTRWRRSRWSEKLSMEKNQTKKWCGSHPHQATLQRMLSSRVGRMWMETSTVTCLRGNFMSFMGEKYPNSGYIGWADPAVPHYARDTAHFLKETIPLHSPSLSASPNKGL